MIAHLVLFRPRAELTEAERNALLDAIREASRRVPAVRRFAIGPRMADGPSYRLSAFPDFPYAALVEFDDRAGLEAYLAHPAHEALGRHFNAAAESALIYDYEMVAPDELPDASGVTARR